MGMSRPERINMNMTKARQQMIKAIQLALTFDWGDIHQIASALGLPTMTVDEIMRSYHLGPYDRRKTPR